MGNFLRKNKRVGLNKSIGGSFWPKIEYLHSYLLMLVYVFSYIIAVVTYESLKDNNMILIEFWAEKQVALHRAPKFQTSRSNGMDVYCSNFPISISTLILRWLFCFDKPFVKKCRTRDRRQDEWAFSFVNKIILSMVQWASQLGAKFW